ncbi:MAG TPA: hypothetical protein VF510_10500 [Ktedonobacterales bacterium]
MANQPTFYVPPLPPCPECGGTCVQAHALGHTFGVQRIGAVFGGFSPMRAIVCTRCGLTRFYALNPGAVIPR